MFRRTRALRDPVSFTLDGGNIAAERGEPLAVALLGADKTILARSPKLHRPRGPSCLRGACDGCLARVDGVPNVMTCLKPAQGGERIDSQNVVGARQADLLRVTDWFFPQGIDHHHLMAGIPGLSDAMQAFARKLAGLGRLPAEAAPIVASERLEADVVVVGGGIAGIVVASRVSAAGASVLLVDDGLALGGSFRWFPDRVARLVARYPLDGVTVLSRATAAGFYEGELLVARDGPGPSSGAVLVRPRAMVLATGAHDGVLAVPGNDRPGIFSARALAGLLACGVAPSGPVVVAGEGFWAEELERALGGQAIRVAAADVVDVPGTGGVRAVTVRAGGGTERRKAEALALATPGAPAFELGAQAGAEVRADPAVGYPLVVDAEGRAGPGLYGAGECTGQRFDPEELIAAAERVAATLLADRARSSLR